MVALIPARAGSKRVPGKNIRPLAGHPLIAYTIAAAKGSGVFGDRVWVCSDDAAVLRLARSFGVCDVRRNESLDSEADIEWVRHVLDGSRLEAFAILRPTSPFRTAETVRRAFVQFKRQEVHSIRAVQPAKEHPGKQWFIENGCLKPVLDWRHVDTKQPWHSMPTQTLAPAFTQNSSLEMAWTYAVRSFGTISGTKIAPFYTRGPEGLAIDTEDDWTMVYQLAERRPELLPKVTV
jgi:N-acylneuraminate cytidylyltransferase